MGSDERDSSDGQMFSVLSVHRSFRTLEPVKVPDDRESSLLHVLASCSFLEGWLGNSTKQPSVAERRPERRQHEELDPLLSNEPLDQVQVLRHAPFQV